jgi:hypothetical protein
VLVFLVTNFTRVILGIQEVLEYPKAEWCYEQGINYNSSNMIYIMDLMARFLVILNSFANFFVYCMVGSTFREQFFEKLRLKRFNRGSTTDILMTRLRSVILIFNR